MWRIDFLKEFPLLWRAEGEAKEYTIVLSEWTDERAASELQRRLRTGNDGTL